ncbi:LuxR family transcriptional regulator [Amycolatopsis decaplanina DSM 44594]|uniref:LuxR family transcriptional regulator n=1 Tax=Amycolatopsis decaplanina DSM 44594 TaxID=1284240 RepID=M2Z8E3_9PSEU|nr:LuxR family transcriptional regulator [Amycolatopsis decaplanina DSM 44594]
MLPAEVSSFVGRRRERVELKRLVADSRLVTVTGPGGVGKSRLALRVAAELRKGFADGVWWVELAALRDAGLLAQVVAEVLGVQDVTPRPLTDVLAEFLATRSLLLVLDTCEHLVDPCAVLVHRLLRAAPGLCVLATSRQSLRVTGECLYPVPPLTVRPQEHGALSDGAKLFVERARAVRANFGLIEHDTETVVRLCLRLDGIPLAIELAAAQIRAHSVRDVLDRLDDRFDLLVGGCRGGPVRHATLETAIDWSHKLCTPAERLLWARMSVFAGSFDLTAVREVCADDRLRAEDMVELVAELVDKSVLQCEEHRSGMRYRQLDTLRDYGRDRLRQAGDEEVLLRRHRDHYLCLAKKFEAHWCGPDQLDWYERLNREHTNVRAAMDFCLGDRREHLLGLELATALRCYWFGCGYVREGRHHLDRALALNPVPSPTWAVAVWARAWLLLAQGDLDAADASLAPGMAYVEQHGDTAITGWTVYVAGLAAMLRGDPIRGAELAERAANLHRCGGDPGSGLFAALSVQSISLAVAGRYDRAVAVTEEGRAACDRYGERWMRSYLSYVRALAEMGRGDPGTAVDFARDALRFKRLLTDQAGIAVTLDVLAQATAALGQADRAACLLGIAHRLWHTFGLPQLGSSALLAASEHCEEIVRRGLGDAAYQAAFDVGAAFEFDDAIAYALDEQPPPPEPAPSFDGRELLTRREREVAELVAEGLTNQQIATRLVIAKRTAEGHVERILNKLGLPNRTRIATWAAEHGAAARAAGSADHRNHR